MRGVARNSQETEAPIVRNCRQLLDLLERQGRVAYKRVSTTGIPVSISDGRSYFRPNPAAGMADFLVCIPGGVTLHIEAKSPSGALTPSQENWRDSLARVGHNTFHVVKSLGDLQEILRKYGIAT